MADRPDFAKFFDARTTADVVADRIEGGIDRLIQPLGRAAFAEHFGTRAQVIRGPSDKFAALADLASFRAALIRMDAAPGDTTGLRGNLRRAGSSESRLFDVTPPQVGPLLAAGATICVTDIHRMLPGLAGLAQRVKKEMLYSGTVGFNAYLSSADQGFDVHYDARIATSLQIAGEKTWRFTKHSALPFPRNNAVLAGGKPRHDAHGQPSEPWENPVPPGGMEFEEVTLQPGDLLCVPAGAWHAAKAHGYSLALNLYFSAPRMFDLFRTVLEPVLRGEESWRRGVPFAVDDTREIPAGYYDYMAGCIAQLQRVVAALKPDDPQLLNTWLRMVAEGATASGASRVPASTAPSVRRRGIEHDDALVCTSETALAVRMADECKLICGERVADAIPDAWPILSGLEANHSFRARDALEWSGLPKSSWPEVRGLLHELVDGGLLSLVERT